MPLEELTIINAYGPFVHDGVDNTVTGTLGDSHDYIEIHPAEQLWWVNTTNYGIGMSDEYNLLLLGDNSGRYNNGRWQKTPLSGVFAIAFDCNIKTERLRYNIEITNQFNVTHRSSDGKKHYFIYKTDTLIEVNEPETTDILDVSFEDVYFENTHMIKGGGSSNIIKGYVVIKSRIGSEGDYAGNLMLKVTSSRLNSRWNYAGQSIVSPTQVKVTLEKITVLSSDDDNSTFDNENKEDLLGYVAAAAFDPTYRLPQAVIKPVESIRPEFNNLLWYSLDDHGETQLHLGTGQSKIFNVSRLFVVSKNGFIRLVSNLDEDDISADDNPTSLDGSIKLGAFLTDPVDALQATVGTGSPDDRLESDGLGNKKIVWDELIPVSQLLLRKPIRKTFTFSSGATKVQVHLVVERMN